MPLPFLAAAAISAVPSVVKFIGGLFGKNKAKKEQEALLNNVPSAAVLGQYNENVNIARQLAQGMPAAQYAQGRQNIARNQTFGLNVLQDRRSALGGLSSIVRQSNDAALGLDSANATMASRGQQILMGANSALAGQLLNKRQWEQFNPWQAKLAQSQGEIAAGSQNAMSGLDNLAALGISAFSNPNNGYGVKLPK